MPPNPAARAEEFNRLLVEQGLATRSTKYGIEFTDEQRAVVEARGVRLLELAELMEPKGWVDGAYVVREPGAYVNERIAAWLKANPLALSMQRVLDLITPPALYSLSGGVNVIIGKLGDGGYIYRVMADDFGWSGARIEGTCSHDLRHEDNDADCSHQVVFGDMVLRVPDSVAEHFRQAGRRQVQREVADVLALKSHR